MYNNCFSWRAREKTRADLESASQNLYGTVNSTLVAKILLLSVILHVFDKFRSIEPIIYRTFVMQKLCVGRLTISCQTGLAAFQPIANSPPRDFYTRITLWIIGLIESLCLDKVLPDSIKQLSLIYRHGDLVCSITI